MFLEYREASQTPAAFARWQAHWVDTVHSSNDYLARLGEERWMDLMLQRHALAEAVDYGY
jgi:NADH:ubiquinone oxidoreductase subunit